MAGYDVPCCWGMDCDSTWSQIYTSKKCRFIQSKCKFQRTLLGPTLRIGWQNTWYTGGDKKLLHGRKCRSQWINLCWKWLESKLRRRTGAIDSVRGCNSILSGMLVARRFVDKLGFSIKCTAQLLRWTPYQSIHHGLAAPSLIFLFCRFAQPLVHPSPNNVLHYLTMHSDKISLSLSLSNTINNVT